MDQFEAAQVQLLDVSIYNCKIEASESFLEDPSNIEQFRVHHDAQLAFNLEDDLMGIRLRLLVEGLNNEGQNLGINGDFGIENQIYVEGLKDFVTMKEGNHYSIDPEMGNTVFDVVFGTARGIVLEKTRGTYLGPVILPIINSEDLMGNNQSE